MLYVDQDIQINYMKYKIDSICRLANKYSDQLTIFFLALCLIMTSAGISFVSTMPNLFHPEDLASFIQISDAQCQFKEQSLKNYLVYFIVQIKLLLVLSYTNFTFLLIFILLLKAISPTIKTKKPQICIIFFIFLFAMAFTGRCNSLKMKIQDISSCHNDPHSFSVLVGSSDGIYAISWLNLVFSLLLLIFSVEYVDHNHNLEIRNKIKIKSNEGKGGQLKGQQKLNLSNTQKYLQQGEMEDLPENVSVPYKSSKRLKSKDKIIL